MAGADGLGVERCHDTVRIIVIFSILVAADMRFSARYLYGQR